MYIISIQTSAQQWLSSALDHQFKYLNEYFKSVALEPLEDTDLCCCWPVYCILLCCHSRLLIKCSNFCPFVPHLLDFVFGLLQLVWFVGELQFGFSFSLPLQQQLAVLPLLPRLHTVVKHTLHTHRTTVFIGCDNFCLFGEGDCVL